MTTSKNTNANANAHTESSQGDGGATQTPPGPPPQGQPDNRPRVGNAIFKSGPLFISSKGIGWTSWKKRWFILTRTSLVFFRSDPSAVPQKGGEVNLTLGGIDLNNSGSVVVKADKKLLTVLFPDGREGRTFTLKAETSEDLFEWKTALENALAQAPNASLVMGQNGIFKSDQPEGINDSAELSKDKVPLKALVIGRPVLLALEDVDGSPSFLEKALRYIEEHGVKVEGILRQAAAVDDVEQRIREYEQGKTEFIAEEDAHVIGDCVKYFLRELPSSPVPASCCKALLESFRTDRGNRVNNMRVAILETFPEPNRRLLQRILLMMQTVASHKAVNRMSTSAVAACMAPLLLRPLLAGDCEIENDFDVGGDGSIQLLQAAAAANHAQAIVITLLEEYDKIFSDGGIVSPGIYSDSEECESDDEEVTDDDDDESYEDDEPDDASQESDAYTDDDHNNATGSESGSSGDSDLLDNEDSEGLCCSWRPPEAAKSSIVEEESSSLGQTLLPSHDDVQSENVQVHNVATRAIVSDELLEDHPRESSLEDKQTCDAHACIQISASMSDGPMQGIKPTVWGRITARKNLSMESIDYPLDDEAEIQKLELTKTDLQHRISEEVKGNAILQANLEERKKALREHRLALEKEVARLQEELQKEQDKRTALEAGLNKSEGHQSHILNIDEKLKADLEEVSQAETDVTNLKQKVDDLSVQLIQQRELNYDSPHDLTNQPENTPNRKDKLRDTEANTTTHLGKSTNKDMSADDSSISQTKHSNQSQQPDPGRSNSKSSSNSKKSGLRTEGVISTTSALTKLTTRIIFLKERRSQLNEIIDKGRGSGLAALTQNKITGSEVRQSSQTPEQSPGQELQIQDKGKCADSNQSALNPDKGSGGEGQSRKNSEKSKKSISHLDRVKSSESQEGQSSKSKGSGSQPQATPRTDSR